jgi:hypothetical protein
MKKSGNNLKTERAKTMSSHMPDSYDCCWDPSSDFCNAVNLAPENE